MRSTCMQLLLLLATCLVAATSAVTAADVGVTDVSHFEATRPDDYAHATEFVLTDSAAHAAAGHQRSVAPPLTTLLHDSAPRNHYEHAMPWADTLHLSFRAHGKTFKFTLTPHHDLNHRDLVVEIKRATTDGAEGVTESQRPVVRAYVGVDDVSGDRCHLVMRDDGTAHATMLVDDGTSVYQTDHITYHRDELAHRYEEVAAAATADGEHRTMVVFRHRVGHPSDIITGVTKRALERQLNAQRAQEAAATPPTSDVRDSPMARKLMRTSGRPARRWRDCYDDMDQGARLTVAVAIDSNLYKKLDSKAQEAATVQLHSSNIIYGPQMNVWLTLKHVLALASTKASDNPDWNVEGHGRGLHNCPVVGDVADDDEGKGTIVDAGGDAEKQLRALRSWRMWGDYKHTAGLWHLLSTCRYGGVLGIAWVNSLCRVSMGTAITTDSQGVSVMWKTFAHEAGHNFGARHSFENGQGTTGGIMDYGPGKLLSGVSRGSYAFNTKLRQREICSTVAETLHRTGGWKHRGMMALGITSRTCWERGTTGVNTRATAVTTNTPVDMMRDDEGGEPKAEHSCLRIRVNSRNRNAVAAMDGTYRLVSRVKSPDFAFSYEKAGSPYNYSLLKRTNTWQIFKNLHFTSVTRPVYAGYEEQGKLVDLKVGDQDDYSAVATVTSC